MKKFTKKDLNRFEKMTEAERNKNFTEEEYEELETMHAVKMIFGAIGR